MTFSQVHWLHIYVYLSAITKAENYKKKQTKTTSFPNQPYFRSPDTRKKWNKLECTQRSEVLKPTACCLARKLNAFNTIFWLHSFVQETFYYNKWKMLKYACTKFCLNDKYSFYHYCGSENYPISYKSALLLLLKLSYHSTHKVHTARQTSEYADGALNIINQSCNARLIQMKVVRKIPVILSISAVQT